MLAHTVASLLVSLECAHPILLTTRAVTLLRRAYELQALRTCRCKLLDSE